MPYCWLQMSMVRLSFRPSFWISPFLVMARVSSRLISSSVFGWCITGLLIRLLFHRYATTSSSVSVSAVGEVQTAVYGKNAKQKVRASQSSLTCRSVAASLRDLVLWLSWLLCKSPGLHVFLVRAGT